jgi:hypothetical protein
MTLWPLYYAWLSGFSIASSITLFADGHPASGVMAIVVSAILLVAAGIERRKVS